MRTFYFTPVVSSSFFFCFPGLFSAVAHWMSTIAYFDTWCSLSANLECTSEIYCTRLAGNTGRKNYTKIAICAQSHNVVGLFANIGTYRHIAVNCNISSTYPHNMVNVGPLTAEIGSRVWGTQNFNAFCVLVSLFRLLSYIYICGGLTVRVSTLDRTRH